MLKGKHHRGGSTSLTTALAVVCWSEICELGSIEIGSLGSVNTLPFDHKSGSPESQLGLLPDINKPPLAAPALLLPLFTRMRRETVRKVPEVSTTQPYGLSKQLISDHFGLRIPAKATLRASIAPFSDSFSAHLGELIGPPLLTRQA